MRDAVRAYKPLFGFVVSMVAALAAAHGAAARTVTPGEMRAGSLLLKTTDDRYVEAPRVGTDVDLTVSGPTARARVTQIFQNPTSGWVEAVYVYPLPEGGAVDTLKMVIGDRIVIGDIKEKQEAKQIYEQAKAAGHKAALIEQERPNIFTNSVANIGPGETVLVQIEYQEPVRQSGDTFSLRIPLVVASALQSEAGVQTVDFGLPTPGRAAHGHPPPQAGAGSRRIAPPVLDPREHAPVNPVAIVGAAAGRLPARRGEEPSPRGEDRHDRRRHARDPPRRWPGAGRPRLRADLAPGRRQGARRSACSASASARPTTSSPSSRRRPCRRRKRSGAREIIFVIDNSGSMGGTSIVQAKASLAYGLGRLRPSDRFNVIRFDHTMDMLFPDAVPRRSRAPLRKRRASSPRCRRRAAPRCSRRCRPRSPTRAPTMRPPCARWCSSPTARSATSSSSSTRSSGMRGRSRVFMVGIGSAPNSFLMTRAAEIGRGTFTHIGSAEQVEERMRALFEKLESPVVTNLTATFADAQADVTPALLPDLYRGEPVVLAAKARPR